MLHRIYLSVILLTYSISITSCTFEQVAQRYNEHVNPYDNENQPDQKHNPERQIRTNLWFRDGNQFRSAYDYRHYGSRDDWKSPTANVLSAPSSRVSNVQMDAGISTLRATDSSPARSSLFWAPQGQNPNADRPRGGTELSQVTARKRWDYFQNLRQLEFPRSIRMTARTEPPNPRKYIPEDTYPRRMIWNERGQFWGYAPSGARDVANDQADPEVDSDADADDQLLLYPYDSDRAQLDSGTCIPPFCIPIDCGEEREDGRCRNSRVTLSCSGSECGPGCPDSKRCTQNDFACTPGTYGPQCRVRNASLCWQEYAIQCPFGCTRPNDTQAPFKCVCNPWSTDAEHNRSCVPIELEVFQCPQGCNARGRCDPQTRRCQCYPGYGGSACEQEMIVCPQGLTGPGCKQDIDECLSGESGCEQRCLNEFGTYRCACYDGYQVNPADVKRCIRVGNCSSHCVPGQGECDKQTNRCVCKPGFEGQWCGKDVDECVTGTHKCDQLCVNIPGSYECRCYEGYTVSRQNRHWCDAVGCNPVCVVNQGTCGPDRRCVCNPGFTGVDCAQDVDECALGQHRCQHVCVNTHGSFRCTCHAGYRPHPSDPNRCTRDLCDPTCVPGQAHCEGRSCMHGVCRSTRDNDTVCECDPGYQGTLCEQDVDECAQNPCEQLCYNTLGSFLCACRSGFQLRADNRTCVRASELCGSGCLNGGVCNPATGRCECRTGFEGPQCEIETNLCQKTKQCEHLCITSRDGTLRCDCRPGYQLASDGRSCVLSMPCPGGCENGGQCFRGRCLCPSGFEGARCEQDQDECRLPAAAHGCAFECVNTYGSYECVCPDGYRQLSDKRTCVRSPTTALCEPPCRNGGICRENGRCECLRGYEGPDCGQDIDECARLKPCDPEFAECRNTPGSFECTCKPGYRLMVDGRHCMAEGRVQHAPHLVFRGRGQKGIVVAERNSELVRSNEPGVVMNMQKRSIPIPKTRSIRRRSVLSEIAHNTNRSSQSKGDRDNMGRRKTPRASFNVYRNLR